jgi:hypothetical protein
MHYNFKKQTKIIQKIYLYAHKGVQHPKQAAEAAEAADMVLEGYSCPYCSDFQTSEEKDYQRHVVILQNQIWKG